MNELILHAVLPEIGADVPAVGLVAKIFVILKMGEMGHF